MASQSHNAQNPPSQPQIQPCRYKTGKTLGAGSYSVVKECVHIETGRYYAAKVINKRMMAGREHMVCGLGREADPGRTSLLSVGRINSNGASRYGMRLQF